jgi:hypothetical protein
LIQAQPVQDYAAQPINVHAGLARRPRAGAVDGNANRTGGVASALAVFGELRDDAADAYDLTE